jgi:hypothetical protein
MTCRTIGTRVFSFDNCFYRRHTENREPGSKIISPILILRVLSAYPVTPDERLAGISEENIKKSSNF